MERRLCFFAVGHSIFVGGGTSYGNSVRGAGFSSGSRFEVDFIQHLLREAELDTLFGLLDIVRVDYITSFCEVFHP